MPNTNTLRFILTVIIVIASGLSAVKAQIEPPYNNNYVQLQYSNANQLRYFFDSNAMFRSNNEIVYFADPQGFHTNASSYFDSLNLKLLPGLITDFSIAHRNYDQVYSSSHKGSWNYSLSHEIHTEKQLGILGYTVYTNQADAQLNFTYKNQLPQLNYNLILLCYTQANSFDVQIKINKTHTFKINPSNYKDDRISLNIGNLNVQTIELITSKNNSEQTEFVFMGLYFKPTASGYCIVHQCNLTGGVFEGIQRQYQFLNQIKAIKPSLIILEPGLAEIKQTFNKWEQENKTQKLLNAIANKIPHTTVCVISSQELKVGKYPIAATYEYAYLLKDWTLKNGFSFIDWYAISGGKGASSYWQNFYLPNEQVLNEKAMAKKAKKIAQSLKKELVMQPKQNVLPNLEVKSIATAAKSAQIDTVLSTRPRKVLHRVAKGQNLYRISLAYNVSQADIVKWNNLQSETVQEGQILILYRGPVEDFTPNIPKVEQKNKTKKYHTVKRGQTLYSIAHQYNITVPELKKLNKLENSKIGVGQVIRVK